eukprot:gene23141-biopygen23486
MVTRSPYPAKWRAARSTRQLFVPVDDPGTAFQPELLVTRLGIRQQPGRQAVLSVVGLGNRRLEISVADHLQQWAEQLFVSAFRNLGHIDNPRRQQRSLGLGLSHFQQRHGAIGQQQFLGIHQRLGSTEGNHRAHERRRRLVKCADFDGRAHRHQACEQRIAPGAFRHQQATGTGATLASGDKRRLDNGVHGRIHIGHFVHHQRVVAAHFQREDLVRAPGELLVQMVAGAAGAGEEQTVDARIRRQGDPGFPCALQQVQHARRQAGVDPALHGQLGDFRGQFARFEQYGVTRQQGRYDVAVRQMTGEVVRAKHRHHTVGLVAQYGSGVAQRAALFAGTFAVALHRDRDLVDHAGDFSRRFPQWLAGFLTDAAGEFVGTAFQVGGEGFQHAQAFFQGTLGPGWKGLARGLNGGLDLLGGSAITRPHHLLGHRVQRLKHFTLASQPFTCDV